MKPVWPLSTESPIPTSNRQTPSLKMSSTSYDQALTLFEGLSFSDKLRFNSEIASLLKKDGKAGKTSKTASDPDAPKRSVAPATAAWFAFVAHCKETMPDRFEGLKKVTDKLQVCKAIRADDMAAYESFAEKFKQSLPAASAASAPVKTSAEAKTSVEAKAPTKAEKVVAVKAALASTAPVVPAVPKKIAPKKAVKTVAPPPAEPTMPQIEIDGENYFIDRESNTLYTIMDDQSLGGVVGVYQPNDAAEPIAYAQQVAYD